jgi:hypothetical protein
MEGAMSWLPQVAEQTRERVSREFDNLGPEACVAEITEELRRNNPEVLQMARKCAADLGAEVMIGLGMFYRLLVVQAKTLRFETLPRVTPQTRDGVAHAIDHKGMEAFTNEAVAELQRTNPELLQMAHHFACRRKDYLATMQGFALVYAALATQAAADAATLH